MKIQIVGEVSDSDERQVVHGEVGDQCFRVYYGRAGRLTRCLGFSAPRFVTRERGMVAQGRSFADALAAVA